MRYSALILALLLLFIPITAFSQLSLIEEVARSYADAQPNLESYRAEIKTDKINEMIAKMTASMPSEMQRPMEPSLVKYWRRNMGSTVRPSGTVMPNMQQMINRFSQQFAIDLDRFFFPADKVEQRAALITQATVKSADTQIGTEILHNIELLFEPPATISGAFYNIGLDLPQDGITRLEFEIDPKKKLLRQIIIESTKSPQLTVAIRHAEFADEQFPVDISITSPDGKIDDHFVTTLETIENFQLPVKQVRNIHRPGIIDEMLVEFKNYKITTKSQSK
jgi:hypothetical protein